MAVIYTVGTNFWVNIWINVYMSRTEDNLLPVGKSPGEVDLFLSYKLKRWAWNSWVQQGQEIFWLKGIALWSLPVCNVMRGLEATSILVPSACKLCGWSDGISRKKAAFRDRNSGTRSCNNAAKAIANGRHLIDDALVPVRSVIPYGNLLLSPTSKLEHMLILRVSDPFM
jgi:hypothetical protein